MRPAGVLRVGKIPYANMYPIFAALEARPLPEGIRFVPGSPSALNRKMRAGRLDVSPSSSIEYGKHPERYLLCPRIAIAAREKVMSVLLLSREPLSALSDEPVAATGASDTSVVLLEILLRLFHGRRNRIVRTTLPPEEAIRRHPAYLAIGDEAIRAAVERRVPHIVDLGAWWRKETGTPFVFALWIASREAAEDAVRGPLLRGFARTLLSAKRDALEAMGRPGRAVPGPSWIPRRFLREYWKNLSYDLDGEKEGLALFFRLACRIGRIPAAPPLRFLDI